MGHGIDTVTVTRVGTQANRTNLAATANPGATNIKVRSVSGFSVGDKTTVGTPDKHQTVTITTVGTPGPNGSGIDVTPALAEPHVNAELVVSPGTGLGLASPLRFNHAANLPFSNRGTGISFQPATTHPHSSNEPVLPLGTGIMLDKPLSKNHGIDAVVRDAAVITAGYQGTPAPNLWFGGPALFSISASSFTNRPPVLNAGNIVLRDAAGLVVDSLNYGGLVDPWASEGYQATSGTGEMGCHVSSPGPAGGFGPAATGVMTNRSAGRFPDGADTDSNCADFHLQPATTLSANSAANATNIKVASVADFAAGQSIAIDTGAESETAVIRTVGTAGATAVGTATSPGATIIPVANPAGFHSGQTITLDSEANHETAVVASTTFNRSSASITVSEPLKFAHAVGAQVSGSGITLTHALSQAHPSGAQVVSKHPTPGAPNQYYARSH
jgi:hypothetical protein